MGETTWLERTRWRLEAWLLSAAKRVLAKVLTELAHELERDPD